MSALAIACLVLAALPLVLILLNLPLYRVPAEGPDRAPPRVSVLIPARDEAHNIGAALESVLADPNPALEVIVLDDDSSDDTAAIVTAMAARDPRVRLLHGAALPQGWCGKNFACAQLAAAAGGEWLLFLDADVRIERDAIGRLAAHAEDCGADLLSGVPRQITRTWGEKLVVPLIHFVLLGYLPLALMRRSPNPAFAAAIGQCLIVRRATYQRVGGHDAVRGSIHDAMALARAFRSAGAVTDLADLQSLAAVRMYDSFDAVWYGFAKNAHEGMGAPGAIGIWTTLLLGGHVLPFVLLLTPVAGPVVIAACGVSLLGRGLLTLRFRQGLLTWLLHPSGILTIVAIQWYALIARLFHRPVSWKGRSPA